MIQPWLIIIFTITKVKWLIFNNTLKAFINARDKMEIYYSYDKVSLRSLFYLLFIARCWIRLFCMQYFTETNYVTMHFWWLSWMWSLLAPFNYSQENIKQPENNLHLHQQHLSNLNIPLTTSKPLPSKTIQSKIKNRYKKNIYKK